MEQQSPSRRPNLPCHVERIPVQGVGASQPEIVAGPLRLAIQRSHHLCAEMVGLGQFKRINDTNGRAAGDQVMRLTYDVLRHEPRASDLCGLAHSISMALVGLRRKLPSGWRRVHGICLALMLGGILPLVGQEPMEMGPFPTREMFPLYLLPMVYQPVDPTPLGRGRWRVSLDHMQANTFEFSDILKDQAPRDAQGRIAITREFVLAHANEYASIPLLFFFDEEIARTSLRLRFGLTGKTDVWAELPIQSHDGGILDGVIEGFHNIGFEQFGRDLVKKDQIALMVMTHGHLVFYSDQRIRRKSQDPTIGLQHELWRGAAWTVSAYVSIKPPLTTNYDDFRSGWDHSAGLTARWQPRPSHVFYGGLGFIRRPRGSAAYNSMAFGSLRDAWGAHGTWEYRRWHHIRPFLQLYLQSGFLPKQPYQKLDRPSLQHDLGFHWQLRKNLVFTFRYLNNITHNENTADMGLGASLTASF